MPFGQYGVTLHPRGVPAELPEAEANADRACADCDGAQDESASSQQLGNGSVGKGGGSRAAREAGPHPESNETARRAVEQEGKAR